MDAKIIGIKAFELGKHHFSLKYFLKALEAPINDDNSRVYVYGRLAFIYHEIGDGDKSKDYSKKALDLYNSYWIPEYLIGSVSKMEELLRNKD